MKICTVFPPQTRTSTHGARMVFHEFTLDLADEIEGLEVVAIGPGEIIRDLDHVTAVDVEGIYSAWDALRFEQLRLPKILEQVGADLLVMPYEGAPLGSPVPVIVFETLGQVKQATGLAARLLAATRKAGAQGAYQRLVCGDLEKSRESRTKLRRVEPRTHHDFRGHSGIEDHQLIARYELPYSYVLAHGVSFEDIPALLACWTWVDGSVGDTVPLVVLVSEGSELEAWETGIGRMDLSHSVHLLTEVEFKELPPIFRKAEALLQGGSGIEHQISRWAMACGLPVVGFEVPSAADVLGSAGYLVQLGDARALGAACLTVIVEPEVKDRLRKAGFARSRAFHSHEKTAKVIQGLLDDIHV